MEVVDEQDEEEQARHQIHFYFHVGTRTGGTTPRVSQLLSSLNLPPYLAYSLRKTCHFLLFQVYSLNNDWSPLDRLRCPMKKTSVFTASHTNLVWS